MTSASTSLENVAGISETQVTQLDQTISKLIFHRIIIFQQGKLFSLLKPE